MSEWNTYFMRLAILAAERSTCLRRQVGAVAVRDKRILATGYNGAPTGMEHCEQTGCLREQLHIPSGERHELCRALHAEQNVIIQAATSGVNIAGATLYCTHHPCIICAKMLINARFERVYYLHGYAGIVAAQFLSEARIATERMEVPL